MWDAEHIPSLQEPIDYIGWAAQVKAAVGARGLLHILTDNPPPEPLKTDTDEVVAQKTERKEVFERQDAMVTFLILTKVSSQYLAQVARRATAKEKWEYLKMTCTPQQQELWKKKMREYTCEPNATGVKVFDDLNALPKRFNGFINEFRYDPNQSSEHLRDRLIVEDTKEYQRLA